jgi:hypothetical protein
MFNRKSTISTMSKPFTPAKPMQPMNNYAKNMKPITSTNNFATPMKPMNQMKSQTMNPKIYQTTVKNRFSVQKTNPFASKNNFRGR